MPEVISDPMGSLPLRHAKYATRCTDLHLGGKGITTLTGFENFIILETLWLNNNKLTGLTNLLCGFGLKNLYCHDNRISSITDTINSFVFLKVLTLNNNCLENIHEVIDELQGLRHLESLDLFNNPIAEEDNYRLRIIAELPWLKLLDRHEVLDVERKKAKKFKKNEQKLLLIKPKKRLTKQEQIELEEKKNKLDAVLDKLIPHIRQQRCFLEKDCLQFDPRKIGYIKESEFERVLSIYGLHQILSDEEYSILLQKYSTDAKIESICPGGTISKYLISYQKFCRDILPPELRTISDPWSMSQAPEISQTATDLDKFVMKIKNKKMNEETESKRKSILSYKSETSLLQLQHRKSNSNGLITINRPNGLDDWSYVELCHLMKNLKTKNISNENSIPRNDVEELLCAVSGLGKTPIMGEDAARRLIFGDSTTTTTTTSSSSTVSFSKLSTRRSSKTGTSTSTSTSLSLGVHTDLNTLMQPAVIRWRDMTSSEALTVERLASERAASSLNQLLRTGAQTEITLHASVAMKSALAATRLNTIAKTTANNAKLSSTGSDRDSSVLIALRRSSTATSTLPSLTASMEHQKMADWTRTFSSLGMRGDKLALAIDRKQRALALEVSSSNSKI
eukprot:gene5469-11001_t